MEKYLKGLLVFRAINFPKTHDISNLVALLPRRTKIELLLSEQRKLTGYAAALRYPESRLVSLFDARKAVALARRVRRDVRRLLPRAALPWKKK